MQDINVQAIMEAAWFAADQHKHQRRKIGNVPYINHPLFVAELATSCRLSSVEIVTSLLHDVLEDCPNKESNDLYIQTMWPISYPFVKLLTKPADNLTPAQKQQYYDGIKSHSFAINVKLLDRAANLSDMVDMLSNEETSTESNIRWAQKYYQKTMEEILPLYDLCVHQGVKDIFWTWLSALNSAILRHTRKKFFTNIAEITHKNVLK